jgi:hypothetical protein
MITLKSISGKRCVFCESHETANVRVKGDRELTGAVCKEHVWKLLSRDVKKEEPKAQS